ncbi:mitochondrial matrix Mmp37-domain-containing protein [Schizophyllum amplum]|uniref:Phosphatidate cytidylyltransferase, mitochondrial n=1 Tax=Schizophyllum amplum TaxID=97359 RepID=A0A550C8H0_9AGAR|nr:mitochondrial matrix Mmp37-domain-containing protein [Auriculariopsis ampla]
MSLILAATKPHARSLPALLIRTLATETAQAGGSDLPPYIPPKPPNTPKQRASLGPQPRQAPSYRSANPRLPPGFGRNQLLPVSNTTRELLESIVAQFNAPIRYAFAYGSGVFEQDGYRTVEAPDGEKPMLDFLFAVTHADHFHSINMNQHPSHYPLSARVLGSDYVQRVQNFGPGVWFNAYAQMNGVTIKYGVTTVDNLCSDLLNWRTLYLAGRMHKPLRIIKDDARVRLTQQVNLTSAVRHALLTLPESFTEAELFERIAAISYTGDPRMVLPAENRAKVQNIVSKQAPQFKELYHRLVVGLPGVHWPSFSSNIQQDVSPHARSAHLRKLPSHLLTGVKGHYTRALDLTEFDDSAAWVRMAGDERLPEVIRQQTVSIVKGPATIQSMKGILSAGLAKSIRYGAAKVSKYWKGTSGSKSS